jgi:hypothetical protein
MKTNQCAQIQSIVDQELPRLLRGEISLEEVLSAYPDKNKALRSSLESAIWLSSHRATLEPRPGFLAAGRNRLMAAIKIRSLLTPWQRFWYKPTPQRFALQSLSILLLLLSIVMVVNNLALASRVTIPGDFLYPVKLGFESVRLALTVDPQAKASLQIEFTQVRTDEIVQMVFEEDYVNLPAAVIRLQTQINQALISLDTAQADNANQAKILVESMVQMLSNEATIMTLVRDTDPTFSFVGLNQAIQATTTGLNELQD